MELKEFKESLEKIFRGARINFTPEEKTFLFSEHYRITGRYVNTSCGTCYKNALGVLLHEINKTQK